MLWQVMLIFRKWPFNISNPNLTLLSKTEMDVLQIELYWQKDIYSFQVKISF